MPRTTPSTSCFVSTRALLCGALPLLLVACMTRTVTGTGQDNEASSGTGDPPECTVDADCAYRDTDDDPCTAATCRSGKCVEKLVKGTPECQCHEPADCEYYERKPCTLITCEAHKCKKNVAPAGPAPEQIPGDCHTLMCDGVAESSTREFDAEDVVDDNPCVVQSCEEGKGLTKTNVADGTACGDGSICFQGACLACKPTNPTSCGGEGPGEPQNDNSATPASYPQHKPFCAFTSGTDTDWYTFYAEDASLSYDVFDFKLWSTAPTLEVCIYVKCGYGSPEGCEPMIPGPNGSQGCCWSGTPGTFSPHWDLNCTGTGEDSGTAYVSVRAPGASACEPYAIVGGY